MPALAQYSDAPVDSMWMGAMIFGGFLFMAAIGALVALSVFLLRKSRSYPRHHTRTRKIHTPEPVGPRQPLQPRGV